MMAAIESSISSMRTREAAAPSEVDNNKLIIDGEEPNPSPSENISPLPTTGSGKRKPNTYRTRALDEDVPVIPVSQILNLFEKRPK